MSHLKNRIGGVMVSVYASSAVDRGLEPWSGQTIDNEIGMCCFSAKNASLRTKSKDWLTRNQNNVSECPSVRGDDQSGCWWSQEHDTGMPLSMQKMGEFRVLEFLDLSFSTSNETIVHERPNLSFQTSALRSSMVTIQIK
jgi:hypothetical protein